MIFKLLVLILIIGGIYFIFFRKKSVTPDSNSKNSSTKNIGEELIPCFKCGTLTSENETIIHNGQQFCSKECAKI